MICAKMSVISYHLHLHGMIPHELSTNIQPAYLRLILTYFKVSLCQMSVELFNAGLTIVRLSSVKFLLHWCSADTSNYTLMTLILKLTK